MKWLQALAALMLLATGPAVNLSRAEDGGLSQVVSDLSKAVHLKREQPGSLRKEGQRERFDYDGQPDAVLSPAPSEPAPAWVRVVCLTPTDANAPRFPRFCGTSPRAPPSA